MNTRPSMSARIVCTILESDFGTGTNSWYFHRIVLPEFSTRLINNNCLSEGHFLGLITQTPARETSGSGELDAITTAQIKTKPPGIVTQNNFIDVCGRCYGPGWPHGLWLDGGPNSVTSNPHGDLYGHSCRCQPQHAQFHRFP